MKVLVADKISKVGLDYLDQQQDVSYEVKAGLPAEELAKLVGGYDGMIIRSGVKVTAAVLANSGNLRCIARAGMGVDNVDVPTATAKGIIVMNTPGGNTISTCELTWALMLAMARKIVPAATSLHAGQWDRKSFEGNQLAGKTLGVIGLGRIGKAVAQRGLAMEMRVLGFDPYFSGKTPQLALEMVRDLDELCRQADYITVHVPKSKETIGMIGAAQIAKMKEGVRLINAARGGIIDPQALLDGLESGRVAGAALDVWIDEPPKLEIEKKLIAHPHVLGVPHLGASTEEAQDQVALEAAEQLVEALRGGQIRNAVNAPGFDQALPAMLRPYVQLAMRMGILLSKITPGAPEKLQITYRGGLADQNVAPVTTYLLVGLMSPYMAQPVNLINAPVLAQQRGLEVGQSATKDVKGFASLMEVSLKTDQAQRSLVGTIFGNSLPRIIGIDGYRVEMKPEGHVLIIFNDDMPGVVGTFGSILGKNKINIADMTLSRREDPKKAVIGINLDNAPSEPVIEEIRGQRFVNQAYYLELPSLPSEEQGD